MTHHAAHMPRSTPPSRQPVPASAYQMYPKPPDCPTPGTTYIDRATFWRYTVLSVELVQSRGWGTCYHWRVSYQLHPDYPAYMSRPVRHLKVSSLNKNFRRDG